MYWFTADEHFGHGNVIKYCKRPFSSVEEMDATLIANHNSVVGKRDITVHVGDFTLRNVDYAEGVIRQLKGQHIFVHAGHDYWFKKSKKYPMRQIWEKKIEDQYVVACHYAMRVWPRSHYGAWQVYGHSHGELPPVGQQLDVGVDCHSFFPVPFEVIRGLITGTYRGDRYGIPCPAFKLGEENG